MKFYTPMKFFCIIFVLLSNIYFAQSSVRSFNNDGVDLYKDKKFNDAEVNFKKSIEKDKNVFESNFNLGATYYKQGKYDESIKSYNKALSLTQDKNLKAKTYYNMGNSMLKNKKYDDAINLYKNSLKLDPKDLETKYNLSYALKMKQQQQQQNKDQNKNNDKNKDNKDQNKQNQDNKNDQNKDNKDKQDQNKNQDQNKDKQDQKKDQQQQQQQKDKLSKQQAQQMLDAMKNNESDLQKKLRKIKAKSSSKEKDW